MILPLEIIPRRSVLCEAFCSVPPLPVALPNLLNVYILSILEIMMWPQHSY